MSRRKQLAAYFGMAEDDGSMVRTSPSTRYIVGYSLAWAIIFGLIDGFSHDRSLAQTGGMFVLAFVVMAALQFAVRAVCGRIDFPGR